MPELCCATADLAGAYSWRIRLTAGQQVYLCGPPGCAAAGLLLGSATTLSGIGSHAVEIGGQQQQPALCQPGTSGGICGAALLRVRLDTVDDRVRQIPGLDSLAVGQELLVMASAPIVQQHSPSQVAVAQGQPPPHEAIAAAVQQRQQEREAAEDAKDAALQKPRQGSSGRGKGSGAAAAAAAGVQAPAAPMPTAQAAPAAAGQPSGSIAGGESRCKAAYHVPCVFIRRPTSSH